MSAPSASTPPDDVWNRKRKVEDNEDKDGKMLILMLTIALMLAWTLVTEPPREVCSGKPVVAPTLSPAPDVYGDAFTV